MIRSWFLIVALLSIPAVPAWTTETQSTRSAERSQAMQPIIEVLELSQKNGKGVLLYMGNQTLGGVVVKISEQTVEMKSREHSRIVVRLERIDAVAMN